MPLTTADHAVAVWAVLVGLIWFGGWLTTVRRTRDQRWRIGPDAEAADPALSVSVVIPARDEVHNIGPCVTAVLASDHPAVQVVVLDDGSTDGTAEVLAGLANPRLTVVPGGDAPLPEGWLGKPWACHRAVQHATGDWLLFVDADVRLAPEAVSRAVGYAEREGVDLLSGFGELVVGSFGERVLQPVVAAVILADNPLQKVNDPERPDALANGQFLLFRRTAYEALGGHQAVAGEVVEDQAFARAIKGSGGKLALLMMRHLFSCRMYHSFGEVWRGWRKNLFPGMDRSWARLFAVIVASSLISVGPYVVLWAGLVGVLPLRWALWALPAVGFMQLLRLWLDRISELPLWVGLLTHGLGNAMVVALFVDSAVWTTFGRAQWKGRTV